MTLLRTQESLGKLVGYVDRWPVSFMLTNGPSLLIKGKAGVESYRFRVPDSWNLVNLYARQYLEVDEQKMLTPSKILNE